MSARIAPTPLPTANVADLQRPQVGAGAPSSVDAPGVAVPAQRAADTLPTLPLPPDPPGTMFAAAVMAGALAPRPTSPEEAFLRFGTVWRPPDSPLRLADRQA